MHIELFSEHKGVKVGVKNQWYWRTVERGRTTAMNGKWDDRSHAAARAKGHIMSCLRPLVKSWGHLTPKFSRPEWSAKRNCWIITWS